LNLIKELFFISKSYIQRSKKVLKKQNFNIKKVKIRQFKVMTKKEKEEKINFDKE
jgi:hypothetical protein